MRHGSLFSGIGGFDLAAEQVGMRNLCSCEVDGFCQNVLNERFKGVVLYEDVRTIMPDEVEDVDIITGGFPCQDVSVAGKRAGLAGIRTGLFWEICRIAAQKRPRWLLLENVPGLLSSGGGADFGVVLRTLDELGYGTCWRVLDAQYFGVPQRRRRVFIVGHLGTEPRPEVLFEPEGCGGDTASGAEAGEEAPAGAGGGADSGCDGIMADGSQLAGCLQANYGTKWGLGDQEAFRGQHHVIGFNPNRGGQSDLAATLGQGLKQKGAPQPQYVAIPAPLVIRTVGDYGDPNIVIDDKPMLAANPMSDRQMVIAQPIAMRTGQTGANGVGVQEGQAYTLDGARAQALAIPIQNKDWGDTKGEAQGSRVLRQALSTVQEIRRPDLHQVRTQMILRRLTPMEAERLQGFPDGWTDVPDERGKPASDSARYRALGNAVAVPVVRWILRRILKCDDRERLDSYARGEYDG